MNKKLLLTVKVLAALLVILLPVILVFTLCIFTAPQYSNTIYGVLDEKYERLNSIDEPKLIVVGGSSVAFGLDSALMEEYIDMPTVNFGLYAALGTKVMLDLSKSNINRGDVVVIAPEMSKQTMSMYFNTENTLMALDDDYSMMRHIDINNSFSLVSGMFSHLADKFALAREGTPDPKGVYNSDSFDKYGDVKYPRPQNTMPLYYDPSTPITLDESIIDDSFIDYLNDYIAFCRRRGATVCFSFSPMNRMALSEDYDSDELSEFEAMLSDKLDCNLISYAEDYILDAEYFFDSNFHLNDTGVKYRTLRLAQDVLLELGEPILILDEPPEPPKLEGGEVESDVYDSNDKYFTYEALADGSYMISGLSELGRKESVLTIPKTVRIEGKNKPLRVIAIGEGAFDGSSVREINIPADSSLRQFMNGAFKGAGMLTRINLYIENCEAVLPPSNFHGAASNFELHVPETSDYRTDYFWSQISVTIIADLKNNS